MTDMAPPITGTPSYPTWNFPTIFVDNVVNLTMGGGVVKFYFMRFDPAMSGNAEPNPAPVCQVVMPSAGFAGMTVFFQQQLELMMQKNEVSKELVNQLKVAAAQQTAQQTSQPQQGQPNAS